jgi:predicted Rossmann-fold nucleotide-binding protein
VILIACGGRDYADTDRVFKALDAVHAKRPIKVLIHGGAPGADHAAMSWAKTRGVHHAKVEALWEVHEKAAGPLRNRAMAGLRPDGVVAFPGGKGTEDMIDVAEAAGIKVMRVKP